MYVDYDGTPSAALVAYNAVADIFAGTKPVALVPLEHNVVVAAFERDGKTVAALWKGAPVTQYPGFERYDSPALVDVSLRPAALSLVNLLGHPLTTQAQGQGTRIAATAFPVYFTSAAAPAAVLAAFRAAKISDGPAPQVTASPEELIAGSFYAAAMTVLTDRLAASPQDAKAWEMLGQCHLALKDYPHAMAAFTKALQLGACLSNALATPDLTWAAIGS
jgi:tetratricopeptide (TPR) repeat protein